MDNLINNEVLAFLKKCLAIQDEFLDLLTAGTAGAEKLAAWMRFKHLITKSPIKKDELEQTRRDLLRKISRLTDLLLCLLRQSSHDYRDLRIAHHQLSGYSGADHEDSAYLEWHRGVLEAQITTHPLLRKKFDNNCLLIRALAIRLLVLWEKELGKEEIDGHQTTKGLIGWLKKVDRKEWIEGIMP